MYDPGLIVSADFRRTASILRLYEKQRVSIANNLYKLTCFPKNKSWGMHLPETHPDVMYFSDLLAQVQETEEDQIGTLTAMFTQSPLYPFTAAYKGLAPGKLVARFIGEIGDPYLRTQREGVEIPPEIRTFPQLKALVGRSVSNGAMPKHVSREQSSFNPKARTRLWLISDQLVNQHDPVFYPVFSQNVARYAGPLCLGWAENNIPVMFNDKEPKPVIRKNDIFTEPCRGMEKFSEKQTVVIAKKRARVLLTVAFLEGLYREAKRLHEM